jgi:WD40 repeat protein
MDLAAAEWFLRRRRGRREEASENRMQPVSQPASVAIPDFAHDVFVSYSRKDKELAWRFAAALGAYRPPAPVGPPRRLNVFLDKEDLASHDYYAAIDKHLRESRKLIVICSPNARASAFVDDEIRRFAEARGAEHIIPILIAGIPNNEATPEREAEKAFPQALCDAIGMPLGVNYTGFRAGIDKFSKGLYYASWYTVLARIFDLGRAVIEERDRKLRMRALRIWTAAAITLALVLSVLTFWAMIERREAEHRGNVNLARRISAEAQLDTGRQNEFVERRILLAAEAVGMLQELGEDTTEAAAVLREVAALKARRVLLRPDARAAWFSDDGTQMFAAEGNRVTAYASATGEAGMSLTAAAPVEAVFGARNGDLIGGVATDGNIYIWTKGQAPAETWTPPTGKVVCAGWDAEAKRLAALTTTGALVIQDREGGGAARKYEVRLGSAPLRPLKGSCLEFGDDLVLARFGVDGSMGAFAVKGNELLGPWSGLSDAAIDGNKIVLAGDVRAAGAEVAENASGFCAEGRFVVHSRTFADPVVPLMTSTNTSVSWRDSKQSIGSIAGTGGDLWCDDTGELAAIGGGQGLGIYRVVGGRELFRIRTQDDFASVLFSPTQRHIATTGAERGVEVWDIGHPSEAFRFRGHSVIAASANGEYVAFTGENGVTVISAVSRKQTGIVRFGGLPEALGVSSSGQFVVVVTGRGEDWLKPLAVQTLVFDLARSADKPVLQWDGVRSFVIKQNDSLLILGAGREISAYRPGSWERAWTYQLNENAAAGDLVLSPDGQLLAVSADSLIILDTSNGRLRSGLPPLPRDVRRDKRKLRHLAFSPDGTLIARTAGRGLVEISRVADGSLVHALKHPDTLPDIEGVAISRDGRFAITLAGSYASLGFPGAGSYNEHAFFTWSLDSGAILHRLPAGQDTGRDFTESIHQNEKLYLADPGLAPGAAFAGGTVFANYRSYMVDEAYRAAADLHVWRFTGTGVQLALRANHAAGESFFGASDNGRLLLTQISRYPKKSHILRVWDLDETTLVEASCLRVTRNLTAAEWRDLVGDGRPYRKTCPAMGL